MPDHSKHLKDIARAVGIFVALLVVLESCKSWQNRSHHGEGNASASTSQAIIHQADFYQRSSDVRPLDIPPGEIPSLTVAIALSDQFGSAQELVDLMTFDDELEKPLLKSGSGKWVGHETGGGQRTIGFEGLDANDMFKDMAPILIQNRWTKGSFVEIYYANPSMRTVRLSLPLVPKQSNQ